MKVRWELVQWYQHLSYHRNTSLWCDGADLLPDMPCQLGDFPEVQPYSGHWPDTALGLCHSLAVWAWHQLCGLTSLLKMGLSLLIREHEQESV